MPIHAWTAYAFIASSAVGAIVASTVVPDARVGVSPRAVLELTARNFKFSERRSRSADGVRSFRRAARAINNVSMFSDVVLRL